MQTQYVHVMHMQCSPRPETVVESVRSQVDWMGQREQLLRPDAGREKRVEIVGRL